MKPKNSKTKRKASGRIHFDFKSLRFKLWAYFLLFAVAIITILWGLQIALLEPYYQHMKSKEIIRIGNQITKEFTTAATQEEMNQVVEHLKLIPFDYDVSAYVYTNQNLAIFDRPDMDMEFHGLNFQPVKNYFQEQMLIPLLNEVQVNLSLDPLGITTFTWESPGSQRNDMVVYGRKFKVGEEEIILILTSQLKPVSSTINILASQLIYITIFALFTAFLLSYWLARRITRPLIHIKNSASKLAKGQYGITFDGGHYTEIVALADTLTYTSQELAKSDNLQKDLIANVTHDLRTPLTMVKSYAEMIRDLSGDIPEKREQHLQVIIDEADRLNTLVTDLLALSKIQSGVDEASMSVFDIRDMAESLMKAYWILEEQEGYHFEFHSNQEFVYVRGDEHKLKQVLANLVNNAVRYSGEAKQVSVSLSVEEDTVKCSVTDLGPGIPKDELEHIWQRYYRSSSTARRSSSGSGLGLAIVKEILTHHNARFGVNSQVGVGSTFWFELPTAEDPTTLFPDDDTREKGAEKSEKGWRLSKAKNKEKSKPEAEVLDADASLHQPLQEDSGDSSQPSLPR